MPWGDGVHTFALPLAQLEELQGKCDAGPLEIFRRLSSTQWRVRDIGETLRLGLIGGGMSPVEAFKLVSAYVYQRPLMESIEPAIRILGAALSGDPDDDPKSEAAGDVPVNFQEGSSPSPQSTEQEQR